MVLKWDQNILITYELYSKFYLRICKTNLQVKIDFNIETNILVYDTNKKLLSSRVVTIWHNCIFKIS